MALGLVAARHELIEMGAHCVVGKPFSDHDLLVGVAWVLDAYARPENAPSTAPGPPGGVQ